MNITPTIIIGDWILSEPVTFLTDLLVSLTSFYALFGLYLKNRVKTNRDIFRILFFLLMALSSLTGGFSHLLSEYIDKSLAYSSWITSLYAVLMLEVWALSFYDNKKTLPVWVIMSVVFAIVATVLVMIFKSFNVIVVHSVIGVLGISLTIRASMASKFNKQIFRKFLYGVIFSVLSGIAFIPILKIHDWFNNADFGHVLLAVSIYFFYRGAKVEIQNGY